MGESESGRMGDLPRVPASPRPRLAASPIRRPLFSHFNHLAFLTNANFSLTIVELAVVYSIH